METLERDYTPKGVRFYYVYKALAHPENSGYVTPFTLEERLMHIQEAERRLDSRVVWLCDTMSNDLSAALGAVQNAELLIDSEMRVAARRSWSDPDELRRDLERLVGKVKNPTRVTDLDMKRQPPPPTVRTGVVPRIEVASRSMRALVVEAKTDDSEMPFYAKLRAEADSAFFRSGAGQLYLGFHLDPLYRVHWNNEVDPLRWEIEVPEGVTVTPSSGVAPAVEEKADADPREFLVDIEGESSEPMKLELFYYACDDANTFCVPAKQAYDIMLERDRFGGTTFRRSRPGGASRFAGGRPGGGGFPGGRGLQGRDPAERSRMMLERFDADGDGKLSKDEAPPPMQERFDSLDTDGDGFLTPKEMAAMRGPFRGGSRGGPGGARP